MTARKTAARPAKRAAPTRTVDGYLAMLSPDKRRALQRLRANIAAAAPNATEGISYQVPVFKLNGRPLVGFGAAATHCTFYVMSTSSAMRARLTELTTYAQGRGSIQFPANKPLPATLVTNIVKARIAEVEGKT